MKKMNNNYPAYYNEVEGVSRYEPNYQSYQLKVDRPNGNGIIKALLAVALVALAGMGGMLIGEKNAINTAPEVPVQVIQVPSENPSQKESVKEIEVPIMEKPSYQGNFYDVFTQMNNVVDNFGTVYDKAFVGNIGINACSKKLAYKLNEPFTTLKGTIALLEEDKDSINCFAVDVYDGEGNHIYESDWITGNNPEPIEINCDITGLNKITIVLEGCDRQCGNVKVLMPEAFTLVGPNSAADNTNI